MKAKIVKILSSFPTIKSYYSGIATIFMLHRVYPFEKNKLFPNENMKVSPEFLERFIIELKDKGYSFINMDRLYHILKNHENIEKQIVLTLDDGYKDNYDIAYPIFKKYEIPFTIYITTSFPERKAVLWWYSIEDLIINNEKLIVDNKKFICRTSEEKNITFLKLRNIILRQNQKSLLHELNKLFRNYEIDWFKRNNELCMSWNNIIALSKDNLCTIAGHTKNHYVFNQLSKEEIIEEIVKANYLIESKIGKKVKHFAYPFGSRNELGLREFNIVKNLGFRTSTTTREGNIYGIHRNYRECLPRVMLTEKFSVEGLGNIRRKRIVTV